MQIAAANLLALQQTQSRPAAQPSGDFAAALSEAGNADDFAPLFENSTAEAPETPAPAQTAARPAPSRPGAQLDIRA